MKPKYLTVEHLGEFIRLGPEDATEFVFMDGFPGSTVESLETGDFCNRALGVAEALRKMATKPQDQGPWAKLAPDEAKKKIDEMLLDARAIEEIVEYVAHSEGLEEVPEEVVDRGPEPEEDEIEEAQKVSTECVQIEDGIDCIIRVDPNPCQGCLNHLEAIKAKGGGK